MAVTGYSTLQIRLHWVIFLLVAAQLIFGEGMSEAFDAGLEVGTRLFTTASVLHSLTGTAIFALVLWRLSIRRSRGVPEAPAGDPQWQKTAARSLHLAFYGILLALPVIGALAWGGGSETLGDLHALLTTVLELMVIVHAAAALYGQYVQKTGIIGRMMKPEA